MIGNDDRSETAILNLPQRPKSTPQRRQPAGSGDGDEDPDRGPEWLFATDAVSGYRVRWAEIQAEFAADTQRAVRHADRLASQLVDELTRTFAGDRLTLEAQLISDGGVSTEDLRVALHHYNSLFSRLLS